MMCSMGETHVKSIVVVILKLQKYSTFNSRECGTSIVVSIRL